MTLSEAQKRAIKKYMQKNKEKITEKQLERYHNGYNEQQKIYYLTKRKPLMDEFKRLSSILTH